MATILVVDDDPIILRMTGYILRKHGHQVVTARNGSDALEQMETTAVDLIISDINMPVMGGLDLLRIIKTGTKRTKTPFILYTANELDERQRRFTVKRASKLLTKPASSIQLMDSVNALLY